MVLSRVSVDLVSAPFKMDLIHLFKDCDDPSNFLRPAMRSLLVGTKPSVLDALLRFWYQWWPAITGVLDALLRTWYQWWPAITGVLDALLRTWYQWWPAITGFLHQSAL